MKKITLTFGLVSGAIIIAYTFAVLIIFGDFSKMSSNEFQMVELLGYLRYLIILVTVFFAMRTFIRKSGQSFNYWQIVKQGIMVTLLVAFLIGIMEYVYMIVNPDFYENYGNMYTSQLKLHGATTETLDRAKQEMSNYKWMQNPLMTGIFYFFETAVIGSVASLIIGLFLKKQVIKPN